MLLVLKTHAHLTGPQTAGLIGKRQSQRLFRGWSGSVLLFWTLEMGSCQVRIQTRFDFVFVHVILLWSCFASVHAILLWSCLCLCFCPCNTLVVMSLTLLLSMQYSCGHVFAFASVHAVFLWSCLCLCFCPCNTPVVMSLSASVHAVFLWSCLCLCFCPCNILVVMSLFLLTSMQYSCGHDFVFASVHVILLLS